MKETGRKQVELLKQNSNNDVTKVQAYEKLNSMALTSVLMFNQRRQGEASKMTVTDYKEKQTTASGRCYLVTFKSGTRTVQDYHTSGVGSYLLKRLLTLQLQPLSHNLFAHSMENITYIHVSQTWILIAVTTPRYYN